MMITTRRSADAGRGRGVCGHRKIRGAAKQHRSLRSPYELHALLLPSLGGEPLTIDGNNDYVYVCH